MKLSIHSKKKKIASPRNADEEKKNKYYQLPGVYGANAVNSFLMKPTLLGFKINQKMRHIQNFRLPQVLKVDCFGLGKLHSSNNLFWWHNEANHDIILV